MFFPFLFIPSLNIELTKSTYFNTQRKLPSPGFQVEVVLVDYDGSQPSRPANTTSSTNKEPVTTENNNSSSSAPSNANPSPNPNPTTKETGSSQQDRDDVFSDSEETAEGGGSTRSRRVVSTTTAAEASETSVKDKEAVNVAQGIEKVSLKSEEGEVRTEGGESKKASPPSVSGPPPPPQPESTSSVSEFKAMAADASVFSFGDDEDYESE